jgi:hypothetical protein
VARGETWVGSLELRGVIRSEITALKVGAGGGRELRMTACGLSVDIEDVLGDVAAPD